MYDDPKSVKDNTLKTLVNDYDYEEVVKVVSLMRIQTSEFVRQAIQNEVRRFHGRNSIGIEPKQRELLNKLRSA